MPSYSMTYLTTVFSIHLVEDTEILSVLNVQKMSWTKIKIIKTQVMLL